MARKRRVEIGQPLTPTASGRFCPVCGCTRADCRCRRKSKAPSLAHAAPPVPNDGFVRVGRQTKGRKGKGVTVVTGVPLTGPELERLARELKQRCGSGGTVRDGVIEIQGDHRSTVTTELDARGWAVKRAGG